MSLRTSFHFHSLKEMVDLMGGSDSATFAEFEDLCVLAFLAVRSQSLNIAHREPSARIIQQRFQVLTRAPSR
jgi:hypothetical protein